jgi:hypothetical protein
MSEEKETQPSPKPKKTRKAVELVCSLAKKQGNRECNARYFRLWDGKRAYAVLTEERLKGRESSLCTDREALLPIISIRSFLNFRRK